MGVTFLTCRCGQRVKAPGARPGRTGRCPTCGSLLEVPGEPGADRPEVTVTTERATSPLLQEAGENEYDAQSYNDYAIEPARCDGIGLAGKARRSTSSLSPRRKVAGSRTAKLGEVSHAPMADGLLPPLRHLEARVLASMLYPLRGAEAVAIVTVMSITFWGLTTLVPEYCLGIWADAGSMGTPSMGMLVILISAIPVLLLLPLIIVYQLQYLGRVLVSSAMGERVPPRTPDRDFDGLFNGLSPWLIWLIFGASFSLLPLVLYVLLEDQPILESPMRLVGLLLLGLPYALTSLMMSFFHDRPWAAAPPGVICALVRHGYSFFPVLFQSSAIVAMSGTAFALTILLRTSHYWLYLAMMLGCWGLAIWISIATMRVLGLHYYRHRDSLEWQHADPRWGVSWRH